MVRTEITHSDEETIELGRKIASELPTRAVVLLIGNLGAGKTTLAKGILSGLGAAEPDEVVSPTFTLIHEYDRGHVYHVDLYRLDTPQQVATLGLEEILDGMSKKDAIVLVEWGERFPDLFSAPRIEIHLEAVSEARRQITFNQ